MGFGHALGGCRHYSTHHSVFASSRSLYGRNRNLLFHEHQPVDRPVSLCAASKTTNELMAHTCSRPDGLPATGLRFFSVHGAQGRLDMALTLFAPGIPVGEPITVSNIGKSYPSELFRFIEVTEQALDLQVGMDVQPIQPGVCCFSYFAE